MLQNSTILALMAIKTSNKVNWGPVEAQHNELEQSQYLAKGGSRRKGQRRSGQGGGSKR